MHILHFLNVVIQKKKNNTDINNKNRLHKGLSNYNKIGLRWVNIM